MTVEIIAELAQGFEGKPEQAHLLMKAAAAAGADAAKYQLVYADELATADYKYYELFKSLEMSDDVWRSLARYAAELGVALHLDIFGARSLRLAADCGVRTVKLHGTDVANVGLLSEVAASPVKRVLLGAGGAYASELEVALGILGAKDVVVLLGFQGYPTANEANQIARVRAVRDSLRRGGDRVAVGFADHAPPGDDLDHALAAVAIGAGAQVIEKHLTLAQVMRLEDHEAALNPDQFAEFVRIVRACSEAMGVAGAGDNFAMSDAEQGYRAMIRRHVVTGRALSAGERLTPTDLVLKRTSAEGVVTHLGTAYEKKLRRNLPAGLPLRPEDIE